MIQSVSLFKPNVSDDEEGNENDPKLKKNRKKLATNNQSKQLEYKSKHDQFCDFSSLVGFRLLHSKNKPLLRGISLAVMAVSSILICLQTRATILSTVQRSYGSVDFRFLVYTYISGGLDDESLKQFNDSASLELLTATSRTFDEYQSKRQKFDNCLLEMFVKKKDQISQESLVECRYKKASAVFAEFLEQEADYYKYTANVYMSPDELVTTDVNGVLKQPTNGNYRSISTSPKQLQMVSQATEECPGRCRSYEYTMGYASHELTLEMLEVNFNELEEKAVKEHQDTMDKLTAKVFSGLVVYMPETSVVSGTDATAAAHGTAPVPSYEIPLYFSEDFICTAHDTKHEDDINSVMKLAIFDAQMSTCAKVRKKQMCKYF
uniref:Uncharacterized protein n=1 Tax=Ditylenchus dipsaci TaxID=166011 RepID=A0A915D7V2_9BILA